MSKESERGVEEVEALVQKLKVRDLTWKEFVEKLEQLELI